MNAITYYTTVYRVFKVGTFGDPQIQEKNIEGVDQL